MGFEVLLVNGLGWILRAAAGGVVEGRAEEGFQRVQRGLREGLPTLLGRPEGAHLIQGVRRAQLRALDRVVRDYQDVSLLGKLSTPNPFIDRARAWCEASLRVTAEVATADAFTPSATEVVSLAVGATVESDSTADGVRIVEDAALTELRAALEDMTEPPAFEAHFRNGSRGKPRFVQSFATHVAEEIAANTAFRDVLNVHLQLQTFGAARDASQLAEQILRQFGPSLVRIEEVVGGVAEATGEIRRTQAAHDAKLDAILEAVSAEKGVPVVPLRQILDRLGELEVPDERIVERLDAWAGEYLSLRAKWSQMTESTPDVAAVKARALARIDSGDFDGARSLFGDAREQMRAARNDRAREEASLLSAEADVDRLQLRYRDAAERYREAASLVSAFDRDALYDYLSKCIEALFRLGDEFGDNDALLEAVEGCRQLLELSPRGSQPVAWALTQNNLGNALSTLGSRQAGNARLEEAIVAYQSALQECTRDEMPLEWALIQHNLATALFNLGQRESGTARLEEAVEAYRAALEVRSRERMSLAWAFTQQNLAGALSRLGEREGGTVHLEEAVTAYRAALEVRSRERAPLEWAATQSNLGDTLRILGEREQGTARLEEAVEAFLAALDVDSRERMPLVWAATQNNLGNTLARLGQRETSTERLEKAVAAFQAALEEITRARVPLDWATTQNNMGTALFTLGERESGTQRLEEAVTAFRAALEERLRTLVPLDWASTKNNLGNALCRLGERESGTGRLKEAVATFQEALEEQARERVPILWAITQNNLGNALYCLGERDEGTEHLEQSAIAYQLALSTFEEAGGDHYATIARGSLERTRELIDERLEGYD